MASPVCPWWKETVWWAIVTARDVRFEKRLDALVRHAMTPKERLVTAPENASFGEITALLHEHRIEKVLLVNAAPFS